MRSTTFAAGTELPFASSVKLPFALCRVEGAGHPARDSDIRFEVLIPEGTGWNGRFRQVGNGGFAGKIPIRRCCAGGDAPMRVDWFATLEQWAEEGKAPASVVARDKNGATQTVTAER